MAYQPLILTGDPETDEKLIEWEYKRRYGKSLSEAQPQDVPWLNNIFGDTIGAFGVGMGNMINDTALGGAGLILGGIGRGVEAISPWSGEELVRDPHHRRVRQKERRRLVVHFRS